MSETADRYHPPLQGQPHPAVDELVALMTALRSEAGCPWDRQQTHQTLKRYLLEETYEVLEAIDRGDPHALRDELGDLLLQIVFHAQLGAEAGHYTLDDIARSICAKLYRRHPHVFGDAQVSDAAEVLRNWERWKQEEHPERLRASRLEGIPATLPALARACKVQRRAAQLGFDWPRVEGPLEKVAEESRELAEASRDGDAAALEAEFGDLLFSLVNVARFLQIDPEEALRRSTKRFESRFRAMEQQAAADGRIFEELGLEEMDRLWENAKDGRSTSG